MAKSPWFQRFTLDDPVLGVLGENRLGPASKKIDTIRVGSFVPVLVGGRIRHCVVEAVTDQDNITVRLGRNGKVATGDSSEFAAAREVSATKTRGYLFEG